AAARPQLAELRAKNPGYLPASLAEAAIDLRENNLDAGRVIIPSVQAKNDYLAASIYEAELVTRSGDLRRAADLYSRLAGRSDLPPIIAQRAAEVRQRLYTELVADAANAGGPESINLLREALAINPGARDV